MALKSLKLHREGTCVRCQRSLPVGTEAWWDRSSRTLTCTGCQAAADAPVVVADLPVLDFGQAGASVAREYERRRRNRESRTREAHPLIGRLLLFMSAAPQHEIAFRSGEVGEKGVAESLARRTAGGRVVLLYDRRMPRGRGNIDMLAVSPTGVFVIDAKNHAGKVRVAHSLFGNPGLLINGRDSTKLLDGLDRQVAAVREVLTAADHCEIPVQGTLCFTQADLPWFRTLKIRGHLLIYRRALARRLNQEGPLSTAVVDTVARRLSAALPRA